MSLSKLNSCFGVGGSGGSLEGFGGLFAFEVVCQSLVLDLGCTHLGIVLVVVIWCLH